MNRGQKPTYLIIMDFAKSFDKGQHRRLLHKLHYYGIRGFIHKWINSWLSWRTEQVVLDGQASDPVPVLSGVPKGSVFGPIMFFIVINDLPDNIMSSICLFVDDCFLYRNIYSIMAKLPYHFRHILSILKYTLATCTLFLTDSFTPLSVTINTPFSLYPLFFGTSYQLISSWFLVLTPLKQESVRSNIHTLKCILF